MIQRDILATLITFLIALSWLRIMDYLAQKGYISGKLSRKIIHIGTGPIFVLCWMMFSQADYCRYLAALVPFSTVIQFTLVGLGIIKDDAAVQAMSRSGDKKEILYGPLFYGIVFVILTIVFWKSSPVGIVALMILCGGDGFADIVGNLTRRIALPWSKEKTVAGSLAMLIGSFVLSYVILLTMYHFKGIAFYINNAIPELFIICIVCAFIESLPVKDFDNITVPVAATLLGIILF